MQPFEVGQILKVTRFYSEGGDVDPLQDYYPLYAIVETKLGDSDHANAWTRWLSPDLPEEGFGHYHGPNEPCQIDHEAAVGYSEDADKYEIIDVDDLPDECCARLALIKMGIEP